MATTASATTAIVDTSLSAMEQDNNKNDQDIINTMSNDNTSTTNNNNNNNTNNDNSTNNNNNNNDSVCTESTEEKNEDPVDSNDDSEIEKEEEEEDEDEDDSEAGFTGDADALLLEAMSLKEEGNTHVSKGELDDAVRCYRRGIHRLNKIHRRTAVNTDASTSDNSSNNNNNNNNNNNSSQQQIPALLVTMYTNLSTVFYQQKKYHLAMTTAGKAIGLDMNHVKSRYRRAVSAKQFGDLHLAHQDLKIAFRMDPTNKAVMKEYKLVKQEMEATKEQQKKALARAFSSSSNNNANGTTTAGGGGFLYQDKAMAAERKAQQAADAKRREQELYKKRKVEWEDECVARMSKNMEAISFEEWDKQRKEKEDQEQKERDKKKQQEHDQEKAARRKAREAERHARTTNDRRNQNSNNGSDSDDDDDELTPSELAQMRGYKKTADGRITSYFTREISEDAKRALAVNAGPQKLSSHAANTSLSSASGASPNVFHNDTSTTTNSMCSSSSSTLSQSMTTASKWNHAGTWEEKDTTTWCENQLRHRLLETKTIYRDSNCSFCVELSEVKEMKGDASVAIVAHGKKRYIFDFHTKLKYRIKRSSDDKDVLAAGVVHLPDICSAHLLDEIEVSFEKGWTKNPKDPMIDPLVETLRQQLATALRQSVTHWVNDFNANY
jgi:hypothetical protein